MIPRNPNLRSTAVAALLSLPLASGAAFAQQSQGTDQTQQSAQQSQDTAQQSSSQPATGSASEAGDQQQDAVVATVGGSEIRGSDVMTVIGMLPPQMQSQPPQMLVPMALEQLILRELIIQEARSQNFADDPEVVALVEGSTQTAEEDAMVQVWVDRKLANVATDEAVQQVYDEAKAQSQQEVPPLEEVRGQIEQYLRQQAMQEIRIELRDGADIVLYDPTGRPVEQPQDNAAQQDRTSQSDSGTTGDTATEGNAAEQTADSASESAETSDGQTRNN